MHSLRNPLNIFLFFIFMFTSYAFADPSAEEQKIIEHLIKTVEISKLIYIRNGQEYDGKLAAAHLREKYEYAKKNISNVDEFIEKVGTKSMMSGKPYLVKYSEGNTIEMNKYLNLERTNLIKNTEGEKTP